MDEEMTFRSDDELLSAWLDGELPPDRATELERRLEKEPALALRLERLSEADAALRDALAPVADEPMPQSLLDAIGAHSEKSPEAGRDDSRGGTVVDLGARRRGREPGAFPWSLALAASVILAIGGVLGYLVAEDGSAPDAALLASMGGVARGSGLDDTLETAPSGTAREIAAGLTVTPVLSFESRDGGYCRELAIAGANGSAAALACRGDDGWRVEALSFLAGPARNGNQAGGEFRPAGRATSAIDAAIDERIVGDALDAAAEAALIGSAWVSR
jgi:anti-sigma factor RsiW